MRSTSPAFRCTLHFPGSSVSSPSAPSSPSLDPQLPTSPPSKPHGRNFLRSASSVTCAGPSNSISRINPSPPRNLPRSARSTAIRVSPHAKRIRILERLNRRVERIRHVRLHARNSVDSRSRSHAARHRLVVSERLPVRLDRSRRSSNCSSFPRSPPEPDPAQPAPAPASARPRSAARFPRSRPPPAPEAAHLQCSPAPLPASAVAEFPPSPAHRVPAGSAICRSMPTA